MEKIQQNFVIVCESAVIDQQTKNLSLFNIFSNINSLGVPAFHPSFVVVTNFSGGRGEHDHSIAILHEDGTEIAKMKGKINFGEGKNAQHIGRFIGVPFPKFGKYHIKIFIDSQEQSLTGKLTVTLINHV